MFNDIQPTFLPAPKRIVVIGDVHGDIGRFLHMLYSLNIFNRHLEWIAEPKNTVVVQLGDQVDSMSRTPENRSNWENLCDVEMIHLTDRLDRIARGHGGRILSLIGNHELMNVEGDFTYVSEHSKEKLPPHRRAHLFRPGGLIARILARRNVVVKVGSHLFCHAGLLPHHLELVGDKIHLFNEVVRKYLRANEGLNPQELSILQNAVQGPMSMLWTRAYVELTQANQLDVLHHVVAEVLTRTGSTRIYTGHNTVPSISNLLQGRVFLVDAGLSRAYPEQGKVQCMQILNADTPDETIQVAVVGV